MHTAISQRRIADRTILQADYRIVLDQTERGPSEITQEPIAPIGPPLEFDDLVYALPKGNTWQPALGWRSISLLPFESARRRWFVLGIEVVALSKRGGGAYPAFYGGIYFRQESVLSDLRRLSALPEFTQHQPLPHQIVDGIFSSDARSPEEHSLWETRAILSAIESLENGERYLMRTSMLSEHCMAIPGHPGPPTKVTRRVFGQPQATKLVPDYFILVDVPAISASFGASARAWLREVRAARRNQPT